MKIGTAVNNDNLIFGYDSSYPLSTNAISSRFYPGEPTVNISSTHHASAHGSYGNVVTLADAPEKGTGWKKVTISTRGSNFRIAQWAYTTHTSNVIYSHSAVFDWGNMRGKGYYMPFDGNGGGTRNYFKNGDYSTNGGNTIDAAMQDGHFGSNIVKSGTHVHAWFIYNDTLNVSGLNDYFYYKEYQVEVNNSVTPYTSGTRSSTQSLIDLKETTEIDVSPISFDTKGQPTFDGADDGLNFGNNSLFNFTNGVATIEAVVKFPSSWTGGSQYPNLISKGGSSGWDTAGWALYGFRDWPNSGQKSWGFAMRNGSTVRNTHRADVDVDKYLHIVATIDGDNIRLYENGVQVATQSQTINPQSNNTNFFIGRGPNSAFFPGDIPIVRVYNTALSAKEIETNYNSYKNRLGI